MLRLVAGTLTVNVSVLLLSLASPDESSLVGVILGRELFIVASSTNSCSSCLFSILVLFFFSLSPSSLSNHRTEIRGRVSAAAAVVRSAAPVRQPVPVRVSQRDTPPRRHLVTGYVLHHARRL